MRGARDPSSTSISETSRTRALNAVAPEQTWERAKQVTNPAERFAYLDAVVDAWAMQDPERAFTQVADLPAAYLSAGQRRRLSVARIVAVSRPVWLLDEPTSALDAPSQGRLSDIMRDHLAGGGIIVAAAHGAIGLERARELKLGAA